MRLIDADKLTREEVLHLWYHLPNGDMACPKIDIDNAHTINAIVIPKNATNGDMIKAMFPNATIEYWAEYSTYNVEFPNDNDVKHFSYHWWNAPYKGTQS